ALAVAVADVDLVHDQGAQLGGKAHGAVGRQPPVLVKVEGDDAGKIQFPRLVHPHQLPVHPFRGIARRQAQHRAGPGADLGGHRFRRVEAQLLVVGYHDHVHRLNTTSPATIVMTVVKASSKTTTSASNPAASWPSRWASPRA